MIGIAKIIGKVSGVLTVPLVILVGIIFILRVVGKSKEKNHVINRLNKMFRAAHVPMGIALITLSAIHGVCSGFVLWGTICFISLVLLSLVYYIRRFIKNWMAWHRALSIVFYITLIVHLIEVSGMR